MATINLTIKSDSSKAQQDIKAFNASNKKVEESLTRLSKKFQSKEINRLSERVKKASLSYGLLGKTVEGNKKTQSLLGKELNKLIHRGIDPADERIKEFSRHYKRLGAETEKLTSKTKNLKTSIGGMTNIAAGVFAVVASIRGTIASIGASYEAARGFTKELKNVTTLTDEVSFGQFKKEILSLNPVLGSAASIAEGAYQAISAGVDPTAAVSFTETASKFAKAANTDILNSVDVITTALNAYGYEASEAGRVSDIFFNTIKQGKTTGEALASNLGKSIPLFSAAKIGLDQMSAGLATMTKLGVSTEESTTQLNATVSAFLKPSEAMKKALKEMGYESGAALLEQKGLAGVIDLLQKKTGGATDKIAQLIPNIRGTRGVLALMNSEGRVYNEVMETMKNASGSTNEAFAKQIDGIDELAGHWSRMKTQLGGLIEAFAKGFAPTLGAIASDFSRMIGEFDLSSIVKNIQVFASSVAGLIEFLAPVPVIILSTVAASKILKISFIGLTGVLKIMRAPIQTLKIAFLGLNKVMKANWVGILVTAIVGLMTWIIHLSKSNKNLAKLLKNIWEGIQKVILTSILYIVKSIQWATSSIGSFIEKISGLSKSIPILGDVVKGTADQFKGWGKDLDGVVGTIKKSIESIGKTKIDPIKAEINLKWPENITRNYYDTSGKKPEIDVTANVTSVVTTNENFLKELEQQRLSSLNEFTRKREEIEKKYQSFLQAEGVNEVELNRWKQTEINKIEQEEAKESARILREKAGTMKNILLGAVDQSIEGYSIIFSSLIEHSLDAFTTIQDESLSVSEKVAETAKAVMGAIAGVVQGVGQTMTANLRRENKVKDKETDKQLKKDLKKLDKEKKENIDAIKAMGLNETEEKKRIDAVEQEIEAKKEARELEAEKEKYARQVELFEVEKGFKIASTIMAGAMAAIQAVAQLGPIVGGIMAGVIAGMTAAQVYLISSQKPPPPSFATGTLAEGFTVPQGYDNDSFQVNARSGERVTIENDEEEKGTPIMITLNLDKRTLLRVIQKAYNNRELVLRA